MNSEQENCILTRKIRKVWVQIKRWQEISRLRNDLKMLGDDYLKDIGISRVDAEREANRPFWDITIDDGIFARHTNCSKPTIQNHLEQDC